MSVQFQHDFDHWNQSVHAVCGRFVTRRAQHDETFIGDILHHDFGGLNVADIHINARSIRRERGNSDRGDDQFYFLVLQRDGVMAIDRGPEQFILNPGDIALIDSAQAFEMRPQGLVNQLSVHLSREAVDRALPLTAQRFGKLDQDALTGRILKGLLQQIASSETNAFTTDQHGGALRDALITLLQPSLLGSTPLPEERSLRRQAEKIINAALPDAPKPVELAARLNISVRQLYRQFEADGDSVCRYIQRQRLEASARELGDARSAAQQITTLAYKWGFTDSAHFSRLFKQHYGVSPKAYRTQALQRP